MLKKILSFLGAIFIFIIAFHSFAFAQIIIEDASFVWEQDLETPTEIPVIPLRIVGEYATTIYHQDLVCPVELINITSSVPSRIVIEYASAIAHFALSKVTVCDWGLCAFAANFGRTDCDTGEPCEYDYDGDDDVDGFDLVEFSTNF